MTQTTRKAGPVRFLDRDLSWLEFNRRVLHQAVDKRTPLLERLNFLAIFSSNLDEFIMKRISRLIQKAEAGFHGLAPETMTPKEQLEAIRGSIGPMLQQQADVYRREIRPALAQHGICLLDWDELTPAEMEAAAAVFKRDVFPVLTPLAVDPGHPFPFISNLSTSLGVTLHPPDRHERLFARVKVPEVLPQWIRLETGEYDGDFRFVNLLDLINQHLGTLFPEMVIESVMPFRVARNADVESDAEEGEDLVEVVSEELRQRRLERVVRLETRGAADPWMLALLKRELRLTQACVYEMPALLDYTSLRRVASLPFPSLHFEPWSPVTPPALADDETDIFSLIRAGDVMVHHPYESFDASVRRFVEAAVDDPEVLAIKMTMYRTGRDTPFIPLLIRAAEAGKQVACLVELKARFDEQENIILAQALEKAGVHVVYGILGYKTHTKTTLVVRREEAGVRCYAHIGTGNYHIHTARLYVDLGILTSHEEITKEVAEVFNYLTGRGRKSEYRKLLVAPVTMRKRFVAMVQREINHLQQGHPAQIVAVMNSLEDLDMSRALYKASSAGVPIELVVRGFCVLRPGVPGLSENIRVLSIVGRFLEHSRIYCFRNGAKDPADGEIYIGSADWMHRNLEDRVEVITPIEDRCVRERIWEILQIYLADQRNAWDMQPDGSYIQRQPRDDDPPFAQMGSQAAIIEMTRNRT